MVTKKVAVKKKAAKEAVPRCRSTVKKYVTFFFPSVFVDDEEDKEVGHRDPNKLKIPAGCHAFRFYERKVVTVDGETLKGPCKNYTGLYYINGDIFTIEQVRSQFPNEKILIDNMRGNGWDKVIRTRSGGWRPFEKDDNVFRVAGAPSATSKR